MSIYTHKKWIEKRNSIRDRDGHRCKFCNVSSKDERLEVHHRQYNYGAPTDSVEFLMVDDEDLVLVCKSCHDVLTDKIRRRRHGNTVIEVSAHTNDDSLSSQYKGKANENIKVQDDWYRTCSDSQLSVSKPEGSVCKGFETLIGKTSED